MPLTPSLACYSLVGFRYHLQIGVILMTARSNALSELTRFWLQSRHGCLVAESIPVKVPYGHSDIDFVAIRPDLRAWTLPDGTQVLRAIVETKDEHDFDPKGQDFGKRLLEDINALGDAQYIVQGKKAHFSMLRQEHYETAAAIFGTTEFHRIFVVHALDEQVRREVCPSLAREKRIHWLTVQDVVADLIEWYEELSSRSALRHTLMGDLWHLLIGYCSLRPHSTQGRVG